MIHLSDKLFEATSLCNKEPFHVPSLTYLPQINYSDSEDYEILSSHKNPKRVNSFSSKLREHVRLGPKAIESLKGKLSIGVKILQVGGLKKVFSHMFSTNNDEKLLKSYHCYVSTTAGPISGMLFISTSQVAFCSHRAIKISPQNGKSMRFRYKVRLPLGKIKSVYQSENIMKPSEKYVEITTVDNYEFWFMGFISYNNTFKHLQKAISHYQVREAS